MRSNKKNEYLNKNGNVVKMNWFQDMPEPNHFTEQMMDEISALYKEPDGKLIIHKYGIIEFKPRRGTSPEPVLDHLCTRFTGPGRLVHVGKNRLKYVP